MKFLITESQYKLLVESLGFSDVYKQTFPKVFNSVCMKYAKGDYDLAQEFCQIGYLRVLDKLSQYSGKGSIGGWVSRVVTTTILDELKKKKREGIKVDVDSAKEDFSDVNYDNDFMGGRFSEKDIKKAIDILPTGYKAVFVMYFFKNMKHKEIADVLNIDEVTSRTQLHKAKKIVKKYLEELPA